VNWRTLMPRKRRDERVGRGQIEWAAPARCTAFSLARRDGRGSGPRRLKPGGGGAAVVVPGDRPRPACSRGAASGVEQVDREAIAGEANERRARRPGPVLDRAQGRKQTAKSTLPASASIACNPGDDGVECSPINQRLQGLRAQRRASSPVGHSESATHGRACSRRGGSPYRRSADG